MVNQESKSTMNTVIEKVVKTSDKFYNSYWSVLFFMSATTIFAVVQIILFYTGILKVNGKGINDELAQQAFWITTVLSISACYLGFLSGILNVKRDPKFLYFTMAQISLQVLVIYRAGMIFAIIAFITSFMVFCHRAWVWKNNKLEQWNLNMKKVKLVMFGVFMAMLVGFLLICALWGDVLYSKQFEAGGQWEGMTAWPYYFDALSAVFMIVGAMFLTLKVKGGFVLYLISKMFLMSVYGATGNIIPLVQLLLFSIMDITGYLAWAYREKAEAK